MVISILFHYMGLWNISHLMLTASGNLWSTWPLTSKTEKLKCLSPMILTTLKVLIKWLRNSSLLFIRLDGIPLLLTITRSLLGKMFLTSSPLKSTWKNLVRNRRLLLTSLPVLKGYLLWSLQNLPKRLMKSWSTLRLANLPWQPWTRPNHMLNWPRMSTTLRKYWKSR